MDRPAPELSIIVPVLDEAALILPFLDHLRERVPGAEVIVADGGSRDRTPELAARSCDRVVSAPRGRALQMNAGAAVAAGEALWFVHADSRVPEGAGKAIRSALRDPGTVGGCFRLRIASRAPVYRISDALGNVGVDLFRIALGDHGIFCRREAFAAVGGYPEVPLLEDAEFYRRLGRHGRVRQLRPAIETSARRYERHGLARTTAIYALILALYACGTPVERLARIYARVSGRATDSK